MFNGDLPKCLTVTFGECSISLNPMKVTNFILNDANQFIKLVGTNGSMFDTP